MHEHFDSDRDKRWACAVTRCLIPEVAPRPIQPVMPTVREVPIPELFERLAKAEARVVELERALDQALTFGPVTFCPPPPP